ncbi:hypothetical protein [Clostridium tyrobutyricum]|uniref:hypothetical protein n=2 Tax=Clostridium tyrobutyricum TaxID=1519 RepID=UPI0003179BD7|nr:hypothetical protein [Clostridium tyrobutyricum]MEA5010037.1 hypothetical protein [Clostridium tyrobutyricum]
MMKCSNVSFNYEWLVHIGSSSKTNDRERSFAGYFGEGFKIASLCAIRDYNLQIETSSDNWKLKVIENEIKIDGKSNSCLAYEIKTLKENFQDTILVLDNFKKEYLEIFYCALYSFYYEDNPLFGEKIYSNDNCSIYHRSDVKKYCGYPSSYNSPGDGIVFAGFQARGSIKESLIFCYHKYSDNDRDREFFSDIDNIDIIIRCVSELSAEIAMEILIIYKRLWYLYPKGKYGYNSYYTVIKNLILKVEEDRTLVDKFTKLYPKILYARKIMSGDKRALNERKQCLFWIKENLEYRLVQDSFKYLNVKSLESKCSQENVLPQINRPTICEQKYIDILKSCVKELFTDFLEIENLPICNVIRNVDASVSGYASLTNNKKKKRNIYNYTYRYKINSICIKERYLKKECFTSALTVFLHELCHTFGGDKSESFSYALTEALRIIISNPRIVEKYKMLWESLYLGV